MIAAKEPRATRDAARMLVIDTSKHSYADSTVANLPDMLQPGDLLVVNDAATLPASLQSRTAAGDAVEIRLLGHLGGSDWKAILFGEGDWRIPTELRDLPEKLDAGSELTVGQNVKVNIVDVLSETGRLVTIRFSRTGVDMWSAIYAFGRPIQYSYLNSDLALWSVQTAYASKPWTAEAPSAGLPLTWKILLELKRRGVGLASLTHAAGLSAIGDEDMDARLPFSERFDIPQTTVTAIEDAHRRGGHVIAVGTTVVRALEGCAVLNGGRVVAGAGETDLKIDRSYRRRVVDGILTGVHDPAQSHFRLLRAFANESLLRRAWRHAALAGYLCHEFGDVCLIL